MGAFQRILVCAGICVGSWTSLAAAGEGLSLTLTAGDPVTVATDSPVVLRAAQDVARDLKGVFGNPVAVVRGVCGRLVVQVDPSLPGPEAYQMLATADGMRLIGSDELGAVYALYDFTHRFAGVDPLWYWTDRHASRRERLELPVGRVHQGPPRFRYRGLFINDEDLLGRWQTPAGQRFLDYPDRPRLMSLEPEADYQRNLLVFYGPVVNYDVMEGIYETVLRLHGNLIIPASFVDVMNPAEAELVRRAVARGLYVSQHHVEPMGVSFFAYISFWNRQARATQFSYPTEQELFHKAWRAYCQKWYELAGDKVLWQLGLRGRGDQSAWRSDPRFDRSRAGGYVTEALATQVSIIRELDRRREPPMTLTLWSEMSELLKNGLVTVPPGVTLINTDNGFTPGAQMNPSFHLPRAEGRTHGAYLHVAAWNAGPHLVQGIDHERLIALIGEIADKGDTTYTIVNASNVREHVLPLRTAMDQLWQAGSPSALQTSVSAAVVPAYRRLLELQRFEDFKGLQMNDARCRELIRTSLSDQPDPNYRHLRTPELAQRLREHAEALEKLARESRAMELPEQDAAMLRHNLADQAEILAGLYRAAAAVQLKNTPGGLREAQQGLEAVRRVYARQEGRWTHWYAGDAKVNADLLLRKLAAAGTNNGPKR